MKPSGSFKPFMKKKSDSDAVIERWQIGEMDLNLKRYLIILSYKFQVCLINRRENTICNTIIVTHY